MTESALVKHEPAPVARAEIVRTAGDVVAAFEEYQKLQAKLDRAMPDCVMTIGSKKFRKKSYWRALAVAFNLDCELVSEKETETAAGPGWLVTYRAVAPNGRFAVGDGACSVGEKSAQQATLHNVRSHAHTRAMNRAISNLVGFGEVSAEEMDREPVEAQPATRPAMAVAVRKITEKQAARMFAIANDVAKEMDGVSGSDIVREVLKTYGIEHTKDIPSADYDTIITEIQRFTPPGGDKPEKEVF